MVFALACATSFILYLHRYTWGVVKQDVGEEFDWNLAQLGLLDSCFSLSYAVGQVPFGVLGDWFGPGAVLGTAIASWSLAMGATAFATGLTSMYIARFVFGFTQAGCYPNLSKVTKVWFPINVRTTVQGWVSSFFGRTGGAMSNILFGTLMLGVFGLPWRTAIGLLTILGVAFAMLFFWLFRSSPGAHPWVNESEAAHISAGDPEAAVATRTKLKWSTALSSGNMWVFLFQQFTSAFVDNLYPYWIPFFLLVEKGVDMKSAGILASLPLFGGALGGMAGGTLQNNLIVKTGNRRWVRSAIGCTGKLLAATFLFVSLGFDGTVAIMWMFFVVKFFSDWSQPTVWGTATDIGGRNSASVFAIVNTVGSLAGFVASPLIGLFILQFSDDVPVDDAEVAAERIATDEDSEGGETHRYRYRLPHKAIVEGETNGTLFVDGAPVAKFRNTPEEAVALEPLESGSVRPVGRGSTFNLQKGEIIIEWEQEPVDPSMQVDYQHRLHGRGWTALFVALAVIYAASALSWLFIDCTKTIEPSYE